MVEEDEGEDAQLGVHEDEDGWYYIDLSGEVSLPPYEQYRDKLSKAGALGGNDASMHGRYKAPSRQLICRPGCSRVRLNPRSCR